MDERCVNVGAARADEIDMKVKRTPIYERVIVAWEITCPVCGTVFESKLERATYCSDNCRVTAFLRKKRAKAKRGRRR